VPHLFGVNGAGFNPNDELFEGVKLEQANPGQQISSGRTQKPPTKM
jgi:hypothetical protein